MSSSPNRTALFVDDFCARTQQNHSNAFIILPSSGVMKQFLSSRYAALTRFERNVTLLLFSMRVLRCSFAFLSLRVSQSSGERESDANPRRNILRSRLQIPNTRLQPPFGDVLLRSILPSFLLRRCSLFSAHCNDLQIHEHLERTTLLQIVTRSRLETYCGKMYFDAIMAGLGEVDRWWGFLT